MNVHEYANIFPLMEGKEYEGLKEDIQKNGLMEGITVYKGEILDGRNRYKACEELGIKPILKEYAGNDPLQFVISTNLKRRHLTESQRAVVGVRYKQYYSKLYPKGGDRKSQEFQTGTSSRLKDDYDHNRDRAGKITGVSGKAIDMAEKVIKEKPEIEQQIMAGKIKVTTAYRELKKEEQKKEVKKLEPEKELQGIFDVIVIDPPWDYTDQSPGDPESKRGTVNYPTMTLEELKSLKLPMGKDCVIWLWVTNSRFKEAIELTDEWKLTRKTILTWDKQNMGVGRYLRNITEHCILCFKGKPYFKNTTWTTLISEKRTEHSVKPEIFYKLVEETCTGRKLDYFGRKERKDWQVYGVKR